ncbi:MAG: VOC family protein [Clostridia bacterium]|nr:VOC family protein [Clostridia bacterium]
MFRMVHENYNVLVLERSIAFYGEALNLKEVRRIARDGFTIVFLSDGVSDFQLELTWLKDRKEPYHLGDGEFHLAFETDHYEEAYAKHQKMGCICFENKEMGIYFIEDPDGYWLEIVPKR